MTKMPWNNPQVTRAGRIKIGRLGKLRTSSKGKEWRSPIKLDRILITHDHRDDTGNFAVHEEVMGALGATRDNPLTEVPIEVHSDHIPDVLACRLARYVGKNQLACSGDGTTALELRGNDWAERECPCPRSTLINEGGDCKPNAVFACSLRVPGHRVIGAVYEFRTTSSISIQRLTGSLHEVQKAVGTLRGIPLTFALRRVELSGKKAPVYCAHIELREVEVTAAQEQARTMLESRASIMELAGRAPARYSALPPGLEDEDEAAMVVQEFYPGGQQAQLEREDDQGLAAVLDAPPTLPTLRGNYDPEGEPPHPGYRAQLALMEGRVAVELTDGNGERARGMIARRAAIHERVDLNKPEHLKALISAASTLLLDGPEDESP